MKEFLPYASFGLSVVATSIAAWVAVRAARWRNAEGHAALVNRVGKLESDAKLTERRLEEIEEDVRNLPTKADFARLEGEVKTTCKIGERVEVAVLRLEDYWLKGGKS